MAVAEAVEGDAVFAVQAQPEVADADAEGHPQRGFEGVRRAAAAGQEVDAGGDRDHDRHVARGLQRVHEGSLGQPVARRIGPGDREASVDERLKAA